MSSAEKIFSVLAICYITGLSALLVLLPSARELNYLLPLSLLDVDVDLGRILQWVVGAKDIKKFTVARALAVGHDYTVKRFFLSAESC